MSAQSEPLRLAELLAEYLGADHPAVRAISAELRRLSAVEAQRDALLEALKLMIDHAEFWINHHQKRHMSEQEFKVWLALGHESNAMLNARSAIVRAAAEIGKGVK